jgi:hypothetical protein
VAKPVIERRYRSVKEAEEYSGLSAWFWRRAAYAGRVESAKIGSRLLIPVSEIDRVLSEGKRPRLESGTDPVTA